MVGTFVIGVVWDEEFGDDVSSLEFLADGLAVFSEGKHARHTDFLKLHFFHILQLFEEVKGDCRAAL